MRTKRILSDAGLLLTLTTGLVWASAPGRHHLSDDPV
jgi:hypothetical protein